MNTGFYQNQTEFRIFVLAIALKMLADSNSLNIVSRVREIDDHIFVELDESSPPF